MTWMATLDLALKILLGFVSLCGIIFMAGSAWSGVQKVIGSQAAIHRRMDEQDKVLVEIRIAVARLQTWKSTQRFRLTEGETPLFKDDE